MLAAKGLGSNWADAGPGLNLPRWSKRVGLSGGKERKSELESELSSAGRGGRQPSARVPLGARTRLTLTRGSVRLVHTAISSRMLISGYRFLWNVASSSCSCWLVKCVRCRRCFFFLAGSSAPPQPVPPAPLSSGPFDSPLRSFSEAGRMERRSPRAYALLYPSRIHRSACHQRWRPSFPPGALELSPLGRAHRVPGHQ